MHNSLCATYGYLSCKEVYIQSLLPIGGAAILLLAAKVAIQYFQSQPPYPKVTLTTSGLKARLIIEVSTLYEEMSLRVDPLPPDGWLFDEIERDSVVEWKNVCKACNHCLSLHPPKKDPLDLSKLQFTLCFKDTLGREGRSTFRWEVTPIINPKL